MSDNLKPHRAAILMKIEISDVLPTGESTNNPIPIERLQEYELAPTMVIIVNGFDMDNCLQKLKQKIDEFKKD